MKSIDALDQYSTLVDIRRKAARRNGIFLGVLFLIVAAITGWLLRSEFNFDWTLLVYIFLLINIGLLINLQLSTEAFQKGMLDFIKILQQMDE